MTRKRTIREMSIQLAARLTIELKQLLPAIDSWGSWQLYLQPPRFETTVGTRVHLSIPIVADFREWSEIRK